MPRTATVKKQNETISGLFLSGEILQRSKREVPLDNPTTEIVTYLVVDEKDRHYYVDDYAPINYYEIGENVNIPVFIKPYKKKSGELSYSLNILKPFNHSTRGVAF